MPLYRRKPFPLVPEPDDLKPEELVFQVRFTKEIFRSYSEYLRRINIYHKRVWTCKATGKGNLTYEEALDSEEKASKRIQSIPPEFVAFVLRDVQFSTLNLKDLVNSIAEKLQGPLTEGAELYGKKNGRLHPCRIMRVLEDDHRTQYEIEWLNNDRRNSGKAVVDGEDLTGKNLPFSKRLLKSFIRDSTSRNLPWVLHENLAKKHGIPTTPPENMKSKFTLLNGNLVNKKRKRSEEKGKTEETIKSDIKVYRRRNNGTVETSFSRQAPDGVNENSGDVKYPIDDLLVQPSDEDSFLMERPTPCRQFNVPMDCVGHLLMVWDFCASYGRLLSLSPFALEDFENALCYKETTPSLIIESCLALLRIVLNDNDAKEEKKRKPKISWPESLCDFLETCCASSELSMHISLIRHNQYSLLGVRVKLAIFRELVAGVLQTDTFKEKLDEYIEERQALAATRRDEALEEGRKRREEKERKKSEASGSQSPCNGVLHEKTNGHLNHHSSRNSGRCDNGSKKKRYMYSEDLSNPSKREIHKLMKNGIKEQIEMKTAEQRKEFLDIEIDKRPIRTYPLGRDKHYRRYWFFRRDGRVFVQSPPDFKEWGYYQTKEEVDALIGSLNTKGEREKALKKQLQKYYHKICSELEKGGTETEEASTIPRSDRFRSPNDDPSAFLKYVNRWR